MDARSEIREFLTSRRAKLKAADVGLPDYGTRRVPGLRREEVAVLAGVSVPYYTRLERGDLASASDSVLEALARALQLDDAERAHLFDLARAAQPIGPPPRRRPTKHRIRPSVHPLIVSMSATLSEAITPVGLASTEASRVAGSAATSHSTRSRVTASRH